MRCLQPTAIYMFSAVARKALAVYAIPTPWLHQDTTIALDVLYEDAPQTPGAPHPASGHSKDGRDEINQVLLSLGGNGDGSLPWRVGIRDGHRSDSVEMPLAIEACLALGLEGVRGIVVDSKAYSRRTLGACLEHGSGLGTLIRTSNVKRWAPTFLHFLSPVALWHRFACTCARMSSSSLGTKVRQRHPRRWYWPYLPK
jgi:transposase